MSYARICVARNIHDQHYGLSRRAAQLAKAMQSAQTKAKSIVMPRITSSPTRRFEVDSAMAVVITLANSGQFETLNTIAVS